MQHSYRFFNNDFSGARSEWGRLHFIPARRIGAANRKVAEAAVRVARKQGVREGRASNDLLTDFRKRFAGDADECHRAEADSLQLPIDVGSAVIETGAIGTHACLGGHGGGGAYLSFGSFTPQAADCLAQGGGFRFNSLRLREWLEGQLQETGQDTERRGFGLDSVVLEQGDGGAGLLQADQFPFARKCFDAKRQLGGFQAEEAAKPAVDAEIPSES